MARPQQDTDVGPRFRQRSNTTTFPSFAWRRPRIETVSTSTVPQPQPLTFEALVEALTPPAVPSLVHARSLAALIATQSPLPRPAVLNPVLGSLCGVDSPASLQCAGYEIMAAYWERHEAKIATADKLTYFSLFLHTSWSTEVGEPRLRALRAITKGGTDVFGIEIALLNLIKGWIEGAFDLYLTCDPFDRVERERSIDLLASYMSSVLGHPETVARISEGDLTSVLQFYAALVGKALDLHSSIPGTTPFPATAQSDQSASAKLPSNGHRRHPSSVSTRSLHPPGPTSTRHPVELMITIYLDHLLSQLKLLAPRVLTLILPLLFRAQAFFASPLPRLSVMSGRPHGPVGLEERIQKTLHSLFGGPYGTSCMMILKQHLSPPTDQVTDSQTFATSLGAHRTLRNDIRQGLCSRMARAYIARLSSSSYTPSGAPGHMDLEKDLMERAWSKDDLSGWDLLKLGRMLCKSLESWTSLSAVEHGDSISSEKDKMLDEAAGTLKDMFQEFEEREDGVEWDEEEATIAGETLRHLTTFVRPLKNADGTPLIIPLQQPNDAPTPFLRTLTSLLARDLSTYMIPSLSMILLSISDHLSDADTAKLPAVMFEQHDLSPASPEWLNNWENILSNPIIFGPTRPLTRLEVMKALQIIYESLKDMHSYRMALAELVLKFSQREAGEFTEDAGFGSSTLWRILADEVVLRTVNQRTSASEPVTTSTYSSTQEMIDLLRRVAAEGTQEEEDDTASVNTSETPSLATFAPFSGGPSSAASPILSRRQSEYRSISARDSGLPSVMSLLSTLAGSRSQSQHSQEQQDAPAPLYVPSSSAEPMLTRASLAVIALVAIFSQLTFTPYSLTQVNVEVASSVFGILVQLLSEAKCPRARLTALQFLMRLRADRDHRIYFVEAYHDAEGRIANLASLIGRGPESGHQDERGHSRETSPEAFPHRMPRSKGTQERDGRRSSRGRGVKPSQSAPSRSRSRAPLPISPPVAATFIVRSKDSLWSVPETLPFNAIDTDTPSEGVMTYDPIAESPRVIPIDAYLIALLSIFENEGNWEILSYVLCHLPVQLANKHFFCGPKCRALFARFLTVLCSGVTTGDLGGFIERWPVGLKARDAHGLAYHTISVLISYRRCFELPLRHALVDVLREGLNGQPSTIICCLHALTLCAFELTTSLKRSLPALLEKLSQIMSNPDMAVHILNFLSIVGSLRELHANLREEDFKMVFGVALQYLQHHNRPGATPTISWAMSQHVRMISFYVVYVWFLAVKLSHRPRHIPYITRQLLLANEGRAEVDEPTEVCFDWLARYTYASADPRPANSVLSEIVMNPTDQSTSSEPATTEKSWLMGNSIVTIRTLARLGWIEVVSRRPSGFTKLICRLENVPLVGPGDVDPDFVSLPAGILMEREEGRVARPDLQDASQSEAVSKEIREVLPASDDETLTIATPDPITGYVWSKTAPSQRRKRVAVDPSFLALQLSPYPDLHHGLAYRRIIDESALPGLFRSLDRTPVIDTHKVGIMYVAPGQTHEIDILRNSHGSPAYTRFLEGIGRLINLRGQVDVYAGGLNPDEDGEYAYAWWDDIGQVLYHTATMMPNAPDDEYCVNKKRHIGNDYVRIVWNDGGRPYKFDTLATQFQFVNIVIEPHSLGAIAAFSNFRSSAGTAADSKFPPSSTSASNPPPHESENEYFKVTVQRATGMKDFTPIGSFKLISAEKLPLLVRQLSLLADWFASVFERTERDEVEVEVITNWRQRLQVVKKFMKGMEEGATVGGETGEGLIAQEVSRNFTTVY